MIKGFVEIELKLIENLKPWRILNETWKKLWFYKKQFKKEFYCFSNVYFKMYYV